MKYSMAICALLLACSGQPEEVGPPAVLQAEPAQLSAPPAPPDVLLVVLDTVRADHSSAYGYTRATTPALAELAQGGVLFERVITAGSWTWPNHASLFTGEPPWVHGATFAPFEESNILARDRSMSLRAMRADLPTLAETLTEAGYQASAFSANPILREELGLTRGFSTVQTPAAPGDGRAADRLIVGMVSGHLQREENKPQFLFLNLFSPHMPYTLTPTDWLTESHQQTLAEPPDWLSPFLNKGRPGMSGYAYLPDSKIRVNDAYSTGQLTLPPEGLLLLADLYDGNIRKADHFLGQILNMWVQAHPDSLIIVTSDHGEFLGEHQLLDHGRFVYPEVLEVPLVISGPGLPAGTRVAEPVQLHEIADLILQRTGIEPESTGALAQAIAGESLDRPMLAAAWSDPAKARHVGGRYTEGSLFIQQGNLVAIVGVDSDTVALFDVSTDPRLLTDLAEARPDQARALRAQAMEMTREVPELTGLAAPELSAEDREQLKALGYLE
jgi:arylsulfatase A-like enzyme